MGQVFVFGFLSFLGTFLGGFLVCGTWGLPWFFQLISWLTVMLGFSIFAVALWGARARGLEEAERESYEWVSHLGVGDPVLEVCLSLEELADLYEDKARSCSVDAKLADVRKWNEKASRLRGLQSALMTKEWVEEGVMKPRIVWGRLHSLRRNR